MNKFILTSLAVAAMSISAQAVTFNFLENGTGNLGSTSTFTQNGLQIQAWTLPSNQDLWAKNDGGTENGLGIQSDPNGDHEIYDGTAIELFGLNGVDLTSITIGSLQWGETGGIFISTTVNGPVSLVGILGGNSSSSNQTFDLSAFAGDYVYLTAGTGDVLVTSVTATGPSVPDGASTMLLLGSALTGLGLIKRKLTV